MIYTAIDNFYLKDVSRPSMLAWCFAAASWPVSLQTPGSLQQTATCSSSSMVAVRPEMGRGVTWQCCVPLAWRRAKCVAVCSPCCASRCVAQPEVKPPVWLAISEVAECLLCCRLERLACMQPVGMLAWRSVLLLTPLCCMQAELENSPSRDHGIDKETETTLRIYGCELIQEGGVLLKFPQAVMATGQVLFHRFYCKHSMRNYNVKVRMQCVAMCCSGARHCVEVCFG